MTNSKTFANQSSWTKTVMAHDFVQDVSIDGNGHKIIYDGKKQRRLMSWTSFSRYCSDIAMGDIPQFILDNKRNFGKAIMEHMELLFRKKATTLEDEWFTTPEEKLACLKILEACVKNKYRMVGVEKPITNKYWYGITDFIVTETSRIGTAIVVEFKTRNNSELRQTDIFQVAIYWNLWKDLRIRPFCHNSTKAQVWVYNTKDNSLTIHKITPKQMKEALRQINAWLTVFKLDQYKFKDVSTIKGKAKPILPRLLEDIANEYGIEWTRRITRTKQFGAITAQDSDNITKDDRQDTISNTNN